MNETTKTDAAAIAGSNMLATRILSTVKKVIPIFRRVTIFSLEYNYWNGFSVEILRLEIETKTRVRDGSLFSFGFADSFIYIEFFYVYFEHCFNVGKCD